MIRFLEKRDSYSINYAKYVYGLNDKTKMSALLNLFK